MHNFNKNLSEYKIGHNNINKSNNNFKDEKNKIQNDKEKEKEKISLEKVTFRIGQIYTDEEENNFIEDLDEEVNDNNKNDNILINDVGNEYENENSVIIKNDIKEENNLIKKIELNRDTHDSKNNSNIKYYNINNISSNNRQTNNTELDDIHDIKINEFYLNDNNNHHQIPNISNTKNNKSHQLFSNKIIQKNDSDNENFNRR